MVWFLLEATYILFLSVSSCLVKLKCWPQNTKSVFALQSLSDKLETKFSHICFAFWFFRYKKKLGPTILAHTNCICCVMFWEKIKRLCFSGGITVVCRRKVSDLSDIIPLSRSCTSVSFFDIHSESLLFLCYDNYYESLSDTPGSQLTTHFMYLIKAMLSNFNFAEGLTITTASAFYIRQLFHLLWIGLMESLLLPFPWKNREKKRVKREERGLRMTDGLFFALKQNRSCKILATLAYSLISLNDRFYVQTFFLLLFHIIWHV